MNDPESVLNSRKLPKAGQDPLPFETEEFKQNILKAE